MDARILIHEFLAGSHQVVKYSVADVSDEEARRMPNPALSPIIWQVGHLANSNAGFMKRAGVTSAAALPDGFGELFKGGSGGQATYPPIETVVRAFDDTHAAFLSALGGLDLDAPNEGIRGMWKNVGGLLGFMNAHRWYHIGKITTLRALLGKPRLFG